jgi:hypothetical protein
VTVSQSIVVIHHWNGQSKLAGRASPESHRP